jgi:hypothetical protein
MTGSIGHIANIGNLNGNLGNISGHIPGMISGRNPSIPSTGISNIDGSLNLNDMKDKIGNAGSKVLNKL